MQIFARWLNWALGGEVLRFLGNPLERAILIIAHSVHLYQEPITQREGALN